MKKRTPLEIVGVIVIFILLLAIVGTFILYGIFNDANSAPNMFGHRVYIMNGDGMEPRIKQGSAVFVKEGVEPNEGNVILCNIDGRLAVVGYVGTEEVAGSDGTVETRYIVKYDQGKADEVWGIGKDDIVGVAKTYSTFLGGLVNFASSKQGMLLIVIIPCALLMVYEIVMIIVSKKKKKNEELVDSVKDHQELDPDEEIERIRQELLREKKEKQQSESEESFGGTRPFKIEFTSDKKPASETDYAESEPLEFKTGSDEQPIKVYSKPEPKTEEPASKPEPKAEEPAPKAEPKAEKKSDSGLDISKLGVTDIDELIKMLEAEKKRLSDN